MEQVAAAVAGIKAKGGVARIRAVSRQATVAGSGVRFGTDWLRSIRSAGRAWAGGPFPGRISQCEARGVGQ